jgi:hypothetical protein
MRTFTPSSWGKMVLAGIAVLVIAGPGFILADPGPSTDYLTPRTARLNGPTAIINGSSHVYTLTVFFQDGSSSVFGAPPATFTQTQSISGGNGSFSDNTYTASNAGKVDLKGRYSNPYGTVESTRRVTIQVSKRLPDKRSRK